MLINETLTTDTRFILEDVAEMIAAAGGTADRNRWGGYDFAAIYDVKTAHILQGVRLVLEDNQVAIYKFTGRGTLAAQTRMTGANASELVAAIVFAYLGVAA